MRSGAPLCATGLRAEQQRKSLRVESVRLEPELRDALAERTKRVHDTTSSVLRNALRSDLKLSY